jgi:4-hydroxybenzoyl-CoA reductase subunit beta
MKMQVENSYIIPKSVTEAIEAAQNHVNSFKYIAGATDVMVNRFQDNEGSSCLIDLTQIDELKGISEEGDYLRIGAMEVLEELQNNESISKNFPLLIEAAMSVGAPLLRKSATLGGNVLCENRCLFYNQSEWWRESVGYCLKCDGDVCIATQGKKACFSELVSDTAPALIAMNAEIELRDGTGSKRLKLVDIYTGDGVHPINIEKGSILTSLYLPLNKGFKSYFKKLRERESLDFTSLTCAMSLDNTGTYKIALSGVDPKPVVVVGQIGDDIEAMIKKAVRGSRAVDNDMYSRKYRREMIPVFIKQGFKLLSN